MLVLSRKVGEAIVFGNKSEIEVTVVEIKEKNVKLSISAPLAIPIYRKELLSSLKSQTTVK